MSSDTDSHVAFVGTAEQVLPFRALGVTTEVITDSAEAKDAVIQLEKRGFRLIYITEDLAASMEDLLQEYSTVTFPTIVPIPAAGGPTGYAMRRLRETIKKAAGTDIFVGEEEKKAD
jgi:V/A-type H+-transporting ATPase subunit F